MKFRGCASLFCGSLLLFMIAGLILIGPRSCADWLLPRESFEDKDVDLVISKLKSWRVSTRDHAVLQLKDRTGDRDKVVAALTDTLLNDSYESVRASAAYALGRLDPPAAEAVPALREALNLPKADRGHPVSVMMYEEPLHWEAKSALKSIGTPEALEAIDEFKRSGPTLVESSVPDGASEVDAEFINQHGITLRFSDRTESGSCRMRIGGGAIVWYQSFNTSAVTFKPDPDDQKLENGKVYTVDARVWDDANRKSNVTITFTTKP